MIPILFIACCFSLVIGGLGAIYGISPRTGHYARTPRQHLDNAINQLLFVVLPCVIVIYLIVKHVPKESF